MSMLLTYILESVLSGLAVLMAASVAGAAVWLPVRSWLDERATMRRLRHEVEAVIDAHRDAGWELVEHTDVSMRTILGVFLTHATANAVIKINGEIAGLRFSAHKASEDLSRMADVPWVCRYDVIPATYELAFIATADGSTVTHAVPWIPGVTSKEFLERHIRREFPGMKTWSLVNA